MEKKSIPIEKQVLIQFEKLSQKGLIDEKYGPIFTDFMDCYRKTIEARGLDFNDFIPLFKTFLQLVIETTENPFLFPLYHKKIRKPFDYYQFGLDLMSPLIDVKNSTLQGKDNLKQIENYLAKGENIVLLANHQVESDPQAISTLLGQEFKALAEKIIYVAGERVISDPLAIPVSLGCDMLCIYSKKYLDGDPEQKHARQLHNTKTMQKMKELLSEGGKIIYVAPSGGRDRPDSKGKVSVAKFDPGSIEMFYLIAQHATKPTHFYPLALATYAMLPPPDAIQKEMGEKRVTTFTPVHIAFGKEIPMEEFPGHEEKNKKQRRENRANFIWNQVSSLYNQIATQ